MPTQTVVPAKAGTHLSVGSSVEKWVPAFAGTTTLWNEPEFLGRWAAGEPRGWFGFRSRLRFRLGRGALGGGAASRPGRAVPRGFGRLAGRAAGFAFRLLRCNQRNCLVEREGVRVGALRQRGDDPIMADI